MESNKQPMIKSAAERYREIAQWNAERPTNQVENLNYLLQASGNTGGKILDAGAGFGRNSIYLAEQGFHVTAVEIDEGAIPDLKDAIQKRNLAESVEVINAPVQEALENVLDDSLSAVVDSGMSHYLSDQDKRAFFETVAKKLKIGGFLSLLHFSEHEPSAQGMGRSRELLESMLVNAFETVLDWKESSWTDDKTGDRHVAWTVILHKKGLEQNITTLLKCARQIKESL
jgi:cyclopropane fatty-acyl-phospholipid synthase-like methyltransferase